MSFRLPRVSWWKRLALAWQALCGHSLRQVFAMEMAALTRDALRYKFKVGQAVHKVGGDYIFRGWIVSRYHKRNNPQAIRYDVENPDGCVHIMNEKQLVAGWPQEWSERDIP